MPLDQWQFQVGDVVMGKNTVYVIEDVQGLDLGDKDSRLYAIPGGDGAEWGREYRRGPRVILTGHVKTPGDAEACWTAAKALRRAFNGVATREDPRTTEPFVYRMPGDAAESTVEGRPDSLKWSLVRLIFGRVDFIGTFDCAQPHPDPDPGP